MRAARAKSVSKALKYCTENMLQKHAKLFLHMPAPTVELEMYMKDEYGVSLAYEYGITTEIDDSLYTMFNHRTMIRFCSDYRIIDFFESGRHVKRGASGAIAKRRFGKDVVKIPEKLLESVLMIIQDDPDKRERCLIFDPYQILCNILDCMAVVKSGRAKLDFLSRVAILVRRYSGKHQMQYWCDDKKKRDSWHAEMMKCGSDGLNLRKNMKSFISIKPRGATSYIDYREDDDAESLVLHEKIVQHVQKHDKKIYSDYTNSKLKLVPWTSETYNIRQLGDYASEIAKNLENAALINVISKLNKEKNVKKQRKLIYKEGAPKNMGSVFDVTIESVPIFLYGSIVFKFIEELHYDKYGEANGIVRMYMSYDPATILETVIKFCIDHEIADMDDCDNIIETILDEIAYFLSDKPVLF